MLFNIAILLAFVGAFVEANDYFRARIPNGSNVPNPCAEDEVWPAFGHVTIGDGGSLNQFGQDFNKAGQTWTKELCQTDSDGDGKTNGEELGDPNCQWTVDGNSEPSITNISDLSHPGICEPINSLLCKENNSFLLEIPACAALMTEEEVLSSDDEEPKASWCPATTRADVEVLELRFNNTHLPSSESILFCQRFTVPDDAEYHIVAFEPISDKHGLLHRIVMFTCSHVGEIMMTTGKSYDDPQFCTVSPKECRDMCLIWSHGVSSRCYDDDVGIPMGRNAFRTVLLQLLFENPSQLSNMTDSSGIRIYYTSHKRPNDLGLLGIGQMDIVIPPKTAAATAKSLTFNNDEACSKRNLAPYPCYWLSSVFFHMRKSGVHAKFNIIKANGTIVTIVDQNVTYDRPFEQHWANQCDAPVFEPGDDFQVECVYDTQNKDDYTFFGGNANDEMCFVYFELYPRPLNKTYDPLFNRDDINGCMFLPGVVLNRLHDCEVLNFTLQLEAIEKSTDAYGFYDCLSDEYPATSCSQGCYSFLERHNFLDSPCINGSLFRVIMNVQLSMNYENIFKMQSHMNKCSSLSDPANETVPDFKWCPAILSEDVKSIEIRFSDIILPQRESTTLCQSFSVPDDDEYQIIAWEPILGLDVLMVENVALMICDDKLLANGRNFSDPELCEMTPKECSAFGVIWKFGRDRRCYSNNSGLAMGRDAFSKVLLQVLFSNIYLLPNIPDSTGIRLFYTNKTRKNDIELIGVGQMDFVLPPRTETAIKTTLFNSYNCSSFFLGPNGPFRIASLNFYMKHAGVRAKFRVRKLDGTAVTLVDQSYDFYSAPASLIWSENNAPILEAGDDFELECTYNTSAYDMYTFFGGEAFDESCMAFLEISPRPARKATQLILNIDDMSLCMYMGDSLGPEILHGCDMRTIVAQLMALAHSDEADGFSTFCFSPEYPAKYCSKACYSFLERHNFLGSPCMKGSVFRLIAGDYASSAEPKLLYYVRSHIERCFELTDISQAID